MVRSCKWNSMRLMVEMSKWSSSLSHAFKRQVARLNHFQVIKFQSFSRSNIPHCKNKLGLSPCKYFFTEIIRDRCPLYDNIPVLWVSSFLFSAIFGFRHLKIYIPTPYTYTHKIYSFFVLYPEWVSCQGLILVTKSFFTWQSVCEPQFHSVHCPPPSPKPPITPLLNKLLHRLNYLQVLGHWHLVFGKWLSDKFFR